jgi:threonine dehydrogenase-like Zn-dependent dehydrogenase
MRAAIVEQTDAVIRVSRACLCGSDLWPYKDLEPTPGGRPMGHEGLRRCARTSKH